MLWRGGAERSKQESMAKSRNGRGGRLPFAAGSPHFGAPGRTTNPADLIPRAERAADLENFLAKAKSKAGPPGVREFSPGATPYSQVPLAAAREAHRCASEGARLINQGRPAEAIALLQRSVQLNPGVAGSHHDLGLALLAAGRVQLAVQPFTFALRIDPNIATAHRYLAYIFDSLGRQDTAMPHYKSAVAMNPDLVDAQLRLGDLYLARGLPAEAAAAFRAAAAATTGTIKALIAEARATEALAAADEALAAASAIVEAHPENAEARAFLGKLLSRAGLSAEAAAHYQRAAELSPEMNDAWMGVTTNRKFTAEDGPLIARMNAALARSDLTPRHRLLVHFALGKAHDDIGNYEEAMRNFEAGNRYRALGGRLRREMLSKYIDRLIEATPPGYRERQPDWGADDATPILIVGLPRSGSTLTEQILSSHPEIAAGGELEFWGMRCAAHEDIWGLTSTPEATCRLADDYLATLRAFGPNAGRVTDKALGNFMLLSVIHRVFPNATLIHCRRNPIDTALSIFTTNFEMHYDFASDRSDIVFFTQLYQRLMAHWREVLPPDRFVEVDYEALVADLEPQARRLIAACGVEWNDACLEPHRNTRKIATASIWQARQPIYRTSVERWRRYEPWLGELRELAPEA